MEVRHREIQVAALSHLRDLAHDGFTVSCAEPGVHDQRAFASDDDGDVWDKWDAAVGNRVDVFRDFFGDTFLDERRLQRTALRGRCGHENAGGEEEAGYRAGAHDGCHYRSALVVRLIRAF